MFDNAVAAIAALRREGRDMPPIAGGVSHEVIRRELRARKSRPRQGMISAQAKGVVSGAASTTDGWPGPSACCVSGGNHTRTAGEGRGHQNRRTSLPAGGFGSDKSASRR